MPPVTDTQTLIALARERDPAACEALMRRHNRRLFRLVRAILGNDAEAEDAIQETYIRAFAHLGEFSGRSSLETWLAAIALNEARARLRRRRDVTSLADIAETELRAAMDQQPYSPVESDPEDLAARTEMRRLLERAIDELPPNFRSVFVLRAVEQLSVQETAESLDIPEETVKSRFHRARALLRQTIGAIMLDTMPEIFTFDGERCDRIVAAVLKRIDS